MSATFKRITDEDYFCHISICVDQAFGAVVKAEVLSSHPVVKYENQS